jgi:nucleoside-diphosphate-sugar epimerase
MKKILIIGGSGFVSGTIARTAVMAGHRVWTVTRGIRPLPKGVIPVIADRHDHAAFNKAVEGTGSVFDMVIDSIGFEPSDSKQDIAVFKKRARHFVFISSDFVFDPAKRTFPQTDDNPYFVNDGYGGKKRLCELEFLNGDTGTMEWTIIRPCHIYGPGSLLGLMPLHSRDKNLISQLKTGKPLRLVGGGYFLQQPIFAPDLAKLIFSCLGNRKTYGQFYCAAGPDIIESREFYRIIAQLLRVKLEVQEFPTEKFIAQNPDQRSFCSHRFYNLEKLRAHRLAMPSTPIEKGLRVHVDSL